MFIFIHYKTILYTEDCNKNWRKAFTIYLNDQLILDSLGIFPINLVLGFNILIRFKLIYFKENINTEKFKFIFSILRIIRILQVFRISKMLNKIEANYGFITVYINLLKSALILVCVAHWSSCLWFWFNLQV